MRSGNNPEYNNHRTLPWIKMRRAVKVRSKSVAHWLHIFDKLILLYIRQQIYTKS